MTEITLSERVKKIHESNLYGVIVECGNGCSLTSLLMSQSGATNTIYKSFQPYSKEIQKELYGLGEWRRSVSKEFIEAVLIKEKYLNTDPKINFIIATSFQLTDSKSLTHGWIGVYYNDKINFYHLSIPYDFSRTILTSTIAISCLQILTNLISKEQIAIDHVDRVIFSDEDEIKSTLKHTIYHSTWDKSMHEDFIVIDSNNKVTRFEDLVRNKEGLILQKGSYNPIHSGHINIMNESIKMFPNYASAFLISINRYDKEPIQIDELVKRIKDITSKGFKVVVCKDSLFKENIQSLRNGCERYKNLSLIFPVGLDTINRIIQTDIDELLEKEQDIIPVESIIERIGTTIENDYTNTSFLVYNRLGFELNSYAHYYNKLLIFNDKYLDTGISSTKIRNSELKNEI